MKAIILLVVLFLLSSVAGATELKVEYYGCGSDITDGECSLAREAAAQINACARTEVLAYAQQGEDIYISGRERKGWAQFHRDRLPGWEDQESIDEAAGEWDAKHGIIRLFASERAGFWPSQLRGVLLHELMHSVGFGHTSDGWSIMNPRLAETSLTPRDCELIHIRFWRDVAKQPFTR